VRVAASVRPMTEPRSGAPSRLLVVVAHPDDETFGLGSLIAGAVDRGAEVVVCCATRGEAGESEVEVAPGQTIGELREAELHEAGRILGVHRHVLLDYRDSGMEGEAAPDSLAGAPLDDVVAALRAVLADVRPTVVVTLDPVTSDGHRDHDRIGAATLAAAAETPSLPTYVWTVPRPLIHRWFEELASARPGSAYADEAPPDAGRPQEEITTVIDGTAYLEVRERAGAAHASQKPPLAGMPRELELMFLGTDHLVRIQPPWTGGAVERMLPL
jgi:LmbE family N-acetylglucosaminyl deacetylase